MEPHPRYEGMWGGVAKPPSKALEACRNFLFCLASGTLLCAKAAMAVLAVVWALMSLSNPSLVLDKVGPGLLFFITAKQFLRLDGSATFLVIFVNIDGTPGRDLDSSWVLPTPGRVRR